MTNTASLMGDESSAVAGTVALLPVETVEQLVGLVNRVERCVNSAGKNLGHMEEELLRGGHEVMRQLLEKAAQAKAAAVPPRCPECQQPLRCLSGGHGTTIQTRFGEIRVERVRGKCRRCHRWRFPADAVLGLPAEGTQSPAVQEIAALTVSKMPAAEAEQVVERPTQRQQEATRCGIGFYAKQEVDEKMDRGVFLCELCVGALCAL